MGLWIMVNGSSYIYMKGYEEFVPAWYENGENAEECFRNALTGTGFKNTTIKTHLRTFSFDFETLIGN